MHKFLNLTGIFPDLIPRLVKEVEIMKVLRCDHCGVIFDIPKEKRTYEIIRNDFSMIKGDYISKDVDLCDDCYKGFFGRED